MEGPTECVVSGSLAAVMRVSRFVGIAPLRFQKQEDGWRVTLFPRLSAIGKLVVTFNALILLGTMCYKLQILSQQRVIVITRTFVWLSKSALLSVTLATITYTAMDRLTQIIRCLDRLQKIDLKGNIHKWMTKGKKHHLLPIFWMTFSLICFITEHSVFSIYGQREKQGWSKAVYFLYYFFFWVIELDMIQFCLIVLQVRTRFSAINECLRSLLQENIKDSRQYRHHETVRRLASVFASTCDVVRDVDRSYGFIQMMFLANIFLHLIIAPYYLIVTFPAAYNSPNKTLFIVFATTEALSCIIHICNLFIIIEPCHLTHNEMRITRELVSNLLLGRNPHSVYDPLAVELEKFWRQLTVNKVSYIPLNVVEMTRGLVIEMFANITTYLAIMINLE